MFFTRTYPLPSFHVGKVVDGKTIPLNNEFIGSLWLNFHNMQTAPLLDKLAVWDFHIHKFFATKKLCITLFVIRRKSLKKLNR